MYIKVRYFLSETVAASEKYITVKNRIVEYTDDEQVCVYPTCM